MLGAPEKALSKPGHIMLVLHDAWAGDRHSCFGIL